jgi:DNA processing protein
LVEVLGNSAPPVLFAAGHLALLKRSAVGFSGSRKSSELGLAIARKLAAELARCRFNVVAGHAAGVDWAAHVGALESGGTTTLVLAEGISHFRSKPEIADVLTAENSLILSEFLPDARWMAHHAMQRNRTICALSQAVVIVEAGLDGGTFNAGETTLDLDIPLFVIDYEHPPVSAAGNRHFLALGARGLRPDAAGNVDAGIVADAIADAGRPVAAGNGTSWLFPDMEPPPRERNAQRSAVK